jgi:capsular polysaccharide biosynthesis protein
VPTDPGRTVVIPVAMPAPSGPSELYRPSPTWQLLARFSLAHLIAALVAGGIVGSLSLATMLRATPTYESTTTVELHQSGLFTSADAGPVIKLIGLRLRYALLAKTDAVLDPISERVGLPADDVKNALTVTLNGSSTLMFSIAKTDDPVESQRLADAMGDQLAIYAANEQTDDKVAPDEQVQIRVVQRAELGEKVAPETSRAVTTGLFAALAVTGSVYAGLQLIVGLARRRR